MTREIIIAGFGGQGVMSMGGTANCAVVLSDEPIGSPVVNRPSELIAMNGPSLSKFEPSVIPGGLILVNASQAEQKVERQDVKAYYIPSMEEAGKLGNFKVANMIMLGAYIKATGALKMDTIVDMLSRIFTGPKAHLVELNIKALEAGAKYIK